MIMMIQRSCLFAFLLLLNSSVVHSHGGLSLGPEPDPDHVSIPATVGLIVEKAASMSFDGFLYGVMHDVDSAELRVEDINDRLMCGMCSGVMTPVEEFLRGPIYRKLVLDYMALTWCPFFGLFFDPKMCNGLTEIYVDSINNPMSRGIFSRERICDESFRWCKTPVIRQLDAQSYVDRMLSEKRGKSNEGYLDGIYRKIAEDEKARGGQPRPVIRSVQMSDIHIDKKYREGAQAEKCHFAICCRDNGKPTKAFTQKELSESRKAAKWGDYNCDLPVRTMQSMFDYIAQNQDELKTSFITWTGDNAPHNIWEQSLEEVEGYMDTVTAGLKKALGNSSIEVYPAIGNHDLYPLDVLEMDKPNSNPAIQNMKALWAGPKWLNKQEQRQFGRNAFYSKPLPNFNRSNMTNSSVPEGRIISLNHASCDALNWWLMYERNDPGHELAWLEKELKDIERNNGFAYIISHIPSSGCKEQYAIRYNALMDRYQHVVRFSSFGHYHTQSMYLSSSTEENQPIGVNIIHGSVTTWGGHNPSFAVIDFDAEYMVPVNIHMYYLDLNEANRQGKEVESVSHLWKKLYDYKSEYDMPDFSPSSVHDLFRRFGEDADLHNQYEWNSHARGHDRPTRTKVDLSMVCQAFQQKQMKKCLEQLDGEGIKGWINFARRTIKGNVHFQEFIGGFNVINKWLVGNWVSKQ